MRTALPTDPIPAGTLVVVARGRMGQQLGMTFTPCYGPGRWPFVRRWMGDRWTKREAKARVLRIATAEDLQLLAPDGALNTLASGTLPGARPAEVNARIPGSVQ